MMALFADHLWQSTLFAAAAALLAAVLQRRRAQARYWLWLAASLKFLMPFSALVAAGQQLGRQLGWLSPVYTTTPIRAAAPPVVSAIVDTVARPFSQAAPVAAVAAVRSGDVAAVAAPVVLIALAVVVGLWLLGFTTVLANWALRWYRVAGLVRRGSLVDSGRELTLLRRLERIGGVRRPIAVVASEARLEPGVFGIVRPVLLWPRAMAARLGDAHVEAILAHEMCHVRRRDNLAAALHAIVQAVFWFHPLVWFIGARLVAERECACDEDVVQLGSDPRVYAESILRACEFSIAAPRPCVAGVSGSDLTHRIERILAGGGARPLTRWQKLLLAAAGMAAIAAPLIVGLITAPRLRAQSLPRASQRRGFGPPDVNRLLGFELLPGPMRSPVDDPAQSVAWTVKIADPSRSISLLGFTGRGLLRFAYGLRDLPIVGGPDWIDITSVDLSLTTDGPATEEEIRRVLRDAFERQMNLATHRDTRDVPIYALVPRDADGRLGPNLRPSTSQCLALTAGTPQPIGGRQGAASLTVPRGRRAGAPLFCGVESNVHGLTAEHVTMAELAAGMTRKLAPLATRPIIDRTGLTGAFDATLNVGFLPAAALMTRYKVAYLVLSPLGVSPLETALPLQLGLRLQDDTASREVLVIDRVQPPGA